MKYILNNKVEFIVADRKLKGNDLEVVLSNPACRLLLVLLENNKLKVTRDELLTKVWDDFGLTSSTSSLNNCVSSIRRGLSQVGLDNLLITVPKEGFVIDIDDLFMEHLPEDYLSERIESTKNEKKTIQNTYGHYTKMLYLLLLVFLILTIPIYIFFEWGKQNSSYIYYDTINKCNVYYYNSVSEKDVKEFFSSKDGVGLSSTCISPSLIYYDGFNLGFRQQIVSVCELDSIGDVNDCKSYLDITAG
ncbi:winged helix-turn-helix domain-containing protein [Enterobacter ludwigii]|uniref:winged helix-turn-helix domain-containing protein n=1 Tax=Enterobacter ludwigii TaxID=299767 RepID=UPI003FD55756